MFDVIELVLSAAVADNGTFTAGYPTGRGAGSYSKAYAHKMSVLQADLVAPADFTVAFTSTITVTYKGSTTLPAGSQVFLQLALIAGDSEPAALPDSVAVVSVVKVELGVPGTADADGVSASQSVGAGANALINGALAVGGEVVFDVPRNVVGAWTTTSVVTVTGEDDYGNAMGESSASGATLTGKKAFKKVTQISSTAAITSATFGSGDVLGLPFFLPNAAFVLKELQDNAAPSAGTFVAGVATAATATTGDVRGTYDPNAAADGLLAFGFIAAIPNPDDRGVPQFAG